MAPLATLVDNFNDGVIGPIWDFTFGEGEEADGVLGLQITQSYSGIQTVGGSTLLGSHVLVEVVGFTGLGQGREAYLAAGADESNYGAIVLQDTGSGLMLVFRSTEQGMHDDGMSIPWDPQVHRWWRIRENGGTTFWETSENGGQWTVRRLMANPSWVTSVDNAWMQAGFFGSTGAGRFTVDNFNNPPASAVTAGAGWGVSV